MKILSSATRLDTTDPVNYPDGQIKDATTSTAKDGTLLNKVLLADIRTFFSYCVRKAGITPNDNFDTVSNSQIADAILGTEKVPITVFYNGVGTGNGGLNVWKTLGGKELRIEGWLIGADTSDLGMSVFQIPVGYRPTKPVCIYAMSPIVNSAHGDMRYDESTGIVHQVEPLGGVVGLYNYINTSIPLD